MSWRSKCRENNGSKRMSEYDGGEVDGNRGEPLWTLDKGP